jgi:hypothetical protein
VVSGESLATKNTRKHKNLTAGSFNHGLPSAAQPQPKKEHDQNNLGQNNSYGPFLNYFVLNYFDLNRPCLDLLEEGPKEKDVQKKQEVDG